MAGLAKPPAVSAGAGLPLALGSARLVVSLVWPLPFLAAAAAFSAPAFAPSPALPPWLALPALPLWLVLPLWTALPWPLTAWPAALLLPFSPPLGPAFLTEALLLLAALAFALSPCVISVLRAAIVTSVKSLSQWGLRGIPRLTHCLRK